MKKVKISLLMIVAVMFILPSCKKGENDPGISFYSRDNRLKATWNLTKIEGMYDSETITYDGSTILINGSTWYSSASFEMTINDDGLMETSQTATYYMPGSSPSTNTYQGYWSWMDSDKNKTFVYLTADPFGVGTSDAYYVDGLHSDELIIKYYYEHVGSGTTTTDDLTFTFENTK